MSFPGDLSCVLSIPVFTAHTSWGNEAQFPSLWSVQVDLLTLEIHPYGTITSIHPIAPASMSPENTRKLMGFYMEVLILGAILQYMVSAALCRFL